MPTPLWPFPPGPHTPDKERLRWEVERWVAQCRLREAELEATQRTLALVIGAGGVTIGTLLGALLWAVLP